MKSKVPITIAINKLYDYIGSEIVDDTPMLLDWAIDADQAIGSAYDYKTTIRVLTLKGCRAALPKGTVDVKGLLLGDHGCDCGLLFDKAQMIYRDLSTGVETSTGILSIDVITSTDVKCGTTMWWVQNNSIIMESNYDGNKVTVKLSLYHFDDDGLPLVNENNIRAISAYLEYMLAKRSRWSKNKNERLPSVDVMDMERTWSRLALNARAESSYPSKAEKEDIAWTINNPMSGRGIIIPDNFC